MADVKESKVEAEMKVFVNDVAAELLVLDPSGALTQAVKDGIVSAEIAEVTIDSGKYSGQYVKLTPGPKVTDEASFVAFAKAVSNGNIFAPKAEGEDEPDTRAPHAVKHLVYGVDLAARSRTSQRIKAQAEGPDKDIERMAKILIKAKPGVSMDDAREMARAMLVD